MISNEREYTVINLTGFSYFKTHSDYKIVNPPTFLESRFSQINRKKGHILKNEEEFNRLVGLSIQAAYNEKHSRRFKALLPCGLSFSGQPKDILAESILIDNYSIEPLYPVLFCDIIQKAIEDGAMSSQITCRCKNFFVLSRPYRKLFEASFEAKA